MMAAPAHRSGAEPARSAVLALLLAGAAAAGACRAAASPGNAGFPPPLPAGAALSAPDSRDSVSTGCRGGKTGGGTGILVTARGQVLRWKQATFEPPRVYEPLNVVDTATTAAIFRELERIRFREIQHQEGGNVTCELVLSGPGGRHRVSWPIGAPPAVLESVLGQIHRLVPDG